MIELVIVGAGGHGRELGSLIAGINAAGPKFRLGPERIGVQSVDHRSR